MEIEFNLDEILKKKKMSMSDAMRACDLSYPTIYNMVKNKSAQVPLKTIQKLTEGLEVEIIDLFRVKKKK